MPLVLCTKEEESRSLSHGAVLCTEDEAFLMHYRVGGEKTGIRRWQDESGRLTKAGYEHYAEMYGWGKRLEKASKLQGKADKAKIKAEKKNLKADKLTARNGRSWGYNSKLTEREKTAIENAKIADSQARIAQSKATKYADKLQRKEDREAKYRNEDGSLNEEGLRKYASATWKPGEMKMNLLGRIKFGSDYADKFNKEHANTMTKEELKKWEADERKKFDEDNKREAALATLGNRMNKFDKLDDKDKAEVMSEVEKTIADYEKKGKDLTKDEERELDGLADWMAEQKSKDPNTAWRFVEGSEAAAKSAEFHNKVDNFDSLGDSERGKIGDEILRRIDQDSIIYDRMRGYKYDVSPSQQKHLSDYNANKDLYDEHESDIDHEVDKLRTFVVDRVYDKSGSINAGEYKQGTNAYTAGEKEREAWKKLDAREDEIKKEINYNSKKYQTEQKRLEAALKKDSIWTELNAVWDKSADDVMGAILKDIGFSDTPANRSLLYQYGWYD